MNSWVDIAYATEYFTYRLNSDEWTAASTAQKNAALETAYNQLISADFDFPTEVTDQMKNALCEQALFLLKFGEGSERRGALQAQGVTKAGIVQEDYEKTGIAIAPLAQGMLEGYYSPASNLYHGDVER